MHCEKPKSVTGGEDGGKMNYSEKCTAFQENCTNGKNVSALILKNAPVDKGIKACLFFNPITYDLQNRFSFRRRKKSVVSIVSLQKI